MTASRRGTLARRGVVALATFAALVVPGAVAGVVACQDSDVVIGIEAPSSTATAPGALDAGLLGAWDAELADADRGPCLADGGCPAGSMCVYPLDAGCGASGECLSGPPAPVGPTLLCRSEPCAVRPYTTSRPSCDDAGDDAGDDAHAEPSD